MVGSRTVFVVDDDTQVRAVLTEMLQREGFSAKEFSTGEELLASDLGRAGCIVVDMRLPAMQGADVIREVKMRNPAVPIVVVTAFGNVPGAVSAMKAGATDFMAKPIGAKACRIIEAAPSRRLHRTATQISSCAQRNMLSLTIGKEDDEMLAAAGAYL